MGRKENSDETLVETQGVNAAEEPAAPRERSDGEPPSDAPDASTSDEMVGLPDQRPGYPGQQRSVDTS